jgi:allantoinase
MRIPGFAIRSNRVVTSQGTRRCALLISDGVIDSICDADSISDQIDVHDFGDWVVAPGIIDCHIHLNDPGRSSWEGFQTGTQAAAAGGITTLIDMPLNSDPVTTDVPSLLAKRMAAKDRCWVDVGFYGGLVPGNAGHLPALIDEGILGIKAFLCDSGLPEFPAATRSVLESAMPILASHGIPLLVHAELTDESAPRMLDARSYSQFVASRPGRWELAAIEMMIELARTTRAKVHIVHLANADAAVIELLRAARSGGLPIRIETCPHYLYFCQEEISNGDPRFKCAPPIRGRVNREALRRALLDGTIDTLGSDHSPCPAEMKHLEQGDIRAAWGGISGVQFLLPAVWTCLKDYGIGFQQLFQWLAAEPAKQLGLDNRKGQIRVGNDADLVVWNPEGRWTVTSDEIRHRNRLSPYVGQVMHGQVGRTYLRGQIVFSQDGLSQEPKGALIRR